MLGMSDEKKSPIKEITQPFIDLVRAPRALWGINLAQMLEGLVYFGILGYLAIYFSDFVFQGVEGKDEWAHNMVAVLTGGITFSMFFLGSVVDKKGVRFALLASFVLLLIGRFLMSAAPTIFGMQPEGLWSWLHITTLVGIFFILIGYGMFQPAAYASVRRFTSPKNSAMGFAMIYAVMNLGGWFPSFAFLLRDDDFAGIGITGTFWVYTGITALALLATALILTKKTIEKAEEKARLETAELKAAEKLKDEEENKTTETASEEPERTAIPVHMWLFFVAVMAAIIWRAPAPWSYYIVATLTLVFLICALAVKGTKKYLANHPLSNLKFFFFIFALIPVQTLFTYNWLVLPQYISRAFDGWIGEYFEITANANPILIFIAAPLVAAFTQKKNVYNMMIWGTAIMAAPAFLLVLGPQWWTLFPYILIMTIGEAMWQPRFLQYAAEIAPEGKIGMYMGVAQLPWFLTKILVPLLYSGWMMDKYCPQEGQQDTGTMWLIYACIAICSSIILVVAKPWLGKSFKTKA
jgi:proton-dependent oligopeptide transporter, POT family